jgi:hypothetical protein
MKSLTCQEVEAQIDLHAAGECDEPARTAIDEHLRHCAACARARQEAQQLLGLLDLRFRERDQLGRLHARLEAEQPHRATRVRVLPFLKRTAALAAVLLLTVGLSGLLGPGLAPVDNHSAGPIVATLRFTDKEGNGQAAALIERAMPGAKHIGQPRGFETDAHTYPLDLGGQTPEAFRRQLAAVEGTNRLPPPPAVHLSLELRNTGDQEVRLRIGAGATELRLDLQGPGTMSVQGRDSLGEPFLSPQVLKVAPHASSRLPIHHLLYGTRDRIRYAFWTEAGEYTLTVHYRVAVFPSSRGAPRAKVTDPAAENLRYITLTSAPIKIQVKGKR